MTTESFSIFLETVTLLSLSLLIATLLLLLEDEIILFVCIISLKLFGITLLLYGEVEGSAPLVLEGGRTKGAEFILTALPQLRIILYPSKSKSCKSF